MRAAWLLALSALAAVPAAADDRQLISLNSGTIDPKAPPERSPALRLRPGDEGDQYVLVKFPGPVTGAQLRALRASTARVYTYLPHDAFLVRAAPGRSPRAPWSGPYHPGYKISRFVAALEAAGQNASERPRLLMVQVYPDADLERTLEAMSALGVRVVGAQKGDFFSRVRLLLTPAEVARYREPLALMPDVFWIEAEGRRVLRNDTTVWVGQSGLSAGQTTPIFAHGIYGQGQVVGIIDTGIDADSCYFRDPALGLPPRNPCNAGTVIDANQRKVLGVDFLWSNECFGGVGVGEWDTQNHGTHVAGTVAGDNFANILLHDPGDGMAPGAKLVIQDAGYLVDDCGDLPGIGCPVVDLNPLFQQAYDQGARLHTNSWGDQENASPQNNYTAGSQDVDEFMWNHQDFLIFFAAGNSGPGAATVGSPSTAKSVISVGATQRGASANNMASFSSCGPTDDGRFKPEITIPGQSIVSARNDFNVASNNCTTIGMSGTSMASPGAAGLTALIRQYFVDGWYPSGAAVPGNGFAPSAALLRATLVNSAVSMTGTAAIPANCQGWGRILLDNALHFTAEPRRLWVKDNAPAFPPGSTNETRTFTFAVQAGEALKVTLAWTDFPSTPAANPHLNDDLDLEVTGPGGTFRGNVFSGGQSVTGGSPDRRNTLEQVLLATPPPGTYTVAVRSFNVPNGPQPFALVVTGNAGESNQPPNADAGPDQDRALGSLIALDGTGSSDPDAGPGPLAYAWTQLSGPAVTLSGADQAVATFTPAVAESYSFRLTVADGADSDTDDVGVTVAGGGGDQTAAFDAGLHAPRCAAVGRSCDSGASLLLGRDGKGPEPNQPNTLGSACADGTSGTFHSDESNDRLKVSTVDGGNLAPGKAVRIEATVWAWTTPAADQLDLYYAADAASPAWTFLATLTPAAPGAQTLSATYTLPPGTLQAVRARLRYQGSASACGPGSFTDHDDLVFAVEGGTPPPPENTAVFDALLGAPKCGGAGRSCDSGPTLLLGRDGQGPEPNQPNTLGGSCADGTAGVFHADESVDRIKVSTTDGTPLAAGRTVRIDATVWAWTTPTLDHLDLYHAPNASSPAWTLVATLTPAASGAQTLSATYTLPAGSLQAVRARFRYQGGAAACKVGDYDDHDDLVFAVP